MKEFPIPATWDRAGLEAVGFEGFVPLVDMDVSALPAQRGVYIVFRPETAVNPVFLDENPITRRKPYAPDKLSGKWLQTHTVLYIGKADAIDGIFGRLGAFSEKSSSHTGGRALGSWRMPMSDRRMDRDTQPHGRDSREVISTIIPMGVR